jgi:hypothetical protein
MIYSLAVAVVTLALFPPLRSCAIELISVRQPADAHSGELPQDFARRRMWFWWTVNPPSIVGPSPTGSKRYFRKLCPSVALKDKGVASSDKYTISGAELICTGVE